LIELYEGMGNQIALQYAGSELVNTINTYRAGSMLSQSRDLLTTMKRYYSNSFTDAEKQDSINLFLGNFIPYQQKGALWDLESDYHLHNKDERPEHVLLSNLPWWEVPLKDFQNCSKKKSIDKKTTSIIEDLYFKEFYQPEKITSFDAILGLSYNHPKPQKEFPTPVVSSMNSPTKTVVARNQKGVDNSYMVQTSAKDLKFFHEYVNLDRLTKLKTTSDDYKSYLNIMENPMAVKTPTDFYSNYVEQCKVMDKLLPVLSLDSQLYENNITTHKPEEMELFAKMKDDIM